MHTVTLILAIVTTMVLAPAMVCLMDGSGWDIVTSAGLGCVLVQTIFVGHYVLRASATGRSKRRGNGQRPQGSLLRVPRIAASEGGRARRR